MADHQPITSPVVYKSAVGFPGYRVGDDGSLWSRFSTRKFMPRDGEWTLLKPLRASHGYVKAALRKDGKTHWVGVHRLVLETFIGPCPEGMCACHWNDIPDDNRLANLRWDTVKANSNDAKRNGGGNHGERNGRRVLDEEKVRAIRRGRLEGLSLTSLAAANRVSKECIWQIINRKTWRHI